MNVPSYSSPVNFGHKAMEDFFDGVYWEAQEKIDGSQFSFQVLDIDGKLGVFCRSHNSQVDINNPGMFQLAVDTVKSISERLRIGWIYRGEFLQKPKHNTLKYDRVPFGNIILYDIDCGDQDYLSYDDLQEEALNIGLECVQVIDYGYDKPTKEQMDSWLEVPSTLGGSIEGVVIKKYNLYDQHNKCLFVKYVSPKFKEVHNDTWKKEHPNRADIVDKIIAEFGSTQRYMKVVQHLQEAGELEGSPKDIGTLMKEFCTDFENECSVEVAEMLWNHFRKDILRGISGGLPAWYKEHLVNQALDE